MSPVTELLIKRYRTDEQGNGQALLRSFWKVVNLKRYCVWRLHQNCFYSDLDPYTSLLFSWSVILANNFSYYMAFIQLFQSSIWHFSFIFFSFESMLFLICFVLFFTESSTIKRDIRKNMYYLCAVLKPWIYYTNYVGKYYLTPLYVTPNIVTPTSLAYPTIAWDSIYMHRYRYEIE